MFIQIDGNSLTFDQILQVIYQGYSVKISDHAVRKYTKKQNVS